MNGKDYPEEVLSRMIDVANQYIYATGLRKGIIAKCYQELGLIVVDAPVHQRADICLTDQEAASMRKAIHRWRRERKSLRDNSI